MVGLAADEGGLAAPFVIPLPAGAAIVLFAVPLTGAVGRLPRRVPAAG
jgi:hypothetical protein